MLVCWGRGRGAPFSAQRMWTGGDAHPRDLAAVSCSHTAGGPTRGQLPEAPHRPVRRRREPHPFFLCWGWGLLAWGCALWHPCQWTRPSESGAAWVPQAGKQTQTRRECRFRRKWSACQQGGVWLVSWGRMLARGRARGLLGKDSRGSLHAVLLGLLGKEARGCLRTWSCAQAAHLRTTGAESTLTSPRPGGVPCGRSAHTCAVLAPRGPPLPALHTCTYTHTHT